MLGLGLIGGSIAHALRRGGYSSIVAWTPSGNGPRAALAAGAIDEAAPSAGDAVDGAELVVLAAPPLACLDLLDELAGALHGRLGPEAVVTDVASTKQAIVDRAESAGLRFVGGHPMAGRELTGFGAADANLFEGRPWVIVPPGSGSPARVDDRQHVEWLAAACGARVSLMSASEHDATVAAVSHLPLVLSAALVEAVSARDGAPRPDWPLARRLASSGWDGMTRLARGDPEMGAGIAVTNAAALVERLHDVRAVIDDWLSDLARDGGPDAEAIRSRLAAARGTLTADD